MRSTWLGGLRLLSCGSWGDSVRFPGRREAPSRAPDGEKPAWNQWRAAGRGRLGATPDGLGVRARAAAVRLSRSSRMGVRGCGAALPSGPGAAAALGSRRRCGWYCAPRLSRLNTCPLFSHWIVWRQAPGAAGGSLGACGAQRRRGQSCSDPNRRTVQAKRMALPDSPFWGGPGWEKMQTGLRSREGRRPLLAGRRARRGDGSQGVVPRADGRPCPQPRRPSDVARSFSPLSQSWKAAVPESAQCLE